MWREQDGLLGHQHVRLNKQPATDNGKPDMSDRQLSRCVHILVTYIIVSKYTTRAQRSLRTVRMCGKGKKWRTDFLRYIYSLYSIFSVNIATISTMLEASSVRLLSCERGKAPAPSTPPQLRVSFAYFFLSLAMPLHRVSKWEKIMSNALHNNVSFHVLTNRGNPTKLGSVPHTFPFRGRIFFLIFRKLEDILAMVILVI